MNNLGHVWLGLLAEAGTASLGSRILAAVIWTGLGILTISLLVLMRTRWGQAKPISKCVVLSVFAHVLFVTYAYTTRLIFDSPPKQPEAVIRVSLRHDGDSAAQPAVSRPWDASASDFQVAPDLISPAKQEFPAETTADEAAPLPTFPMATQDPLPPATMSPSHPAPSIVAAEEPREPAPSELRPEADTVEETIDEPLPSEELAVQNDPPMIDVPPPIESLASASSAPDTLEAQSAPQELRAEDMQPIGEAVPSDRDLTKFASGQPLESVNNTPPPARANAMEHVRPISSGQQRRPASPPKQRRAGDDGQLPDIYQLRKSDDRLTLVKRNGGSEQTEHAVEAALAWLARNQDADGRWDPQQFQAGRESRTLGHDRKGAGTNADTGITGLALLTFLAAGHTHYEGEYRVNVQRGLEFLLSKQAPGGCLAGDAKFFARMYCHGMATLAVSEALAMTGDARLRPYVERAIRYTTDSQDPRSGGWRYHPADHGGDMSQFGWQVMALKSAEMAGIAVPSESRSGMLRFLRSVSKGQHRGLASYRPTDPVSRTMTAEALACRYFLNVDQDYRSINEATRYLTAELPGRATGKPNFYYWYYATLALRQSESEDWRRWNDSLQQALLSRQETVGSLAGSWSPKTVWGSYGGRVYSTSLATLCLEVYYRYLPVYQVDDGLRSAERNSPPVRTLR